MNILSLLTERGILDKGRTSELEHELQKPGAAEEDVLQKAGVALGEILKAKGEYYYAG